MSLKQACESLVDFMDQVFTPTTIGALFLSLAIGGIVGPVVGICLILAEWYATKEDEV